MTKLLVVDDEEPFRRLLKKELTRKGFSVDVAGEGRTALRMLRETSYDVMLLDILMPGMDGLAVMKELREDPAAPPTVVLTARATVETAVEAMKSGAYDYLTKPYLLDELEIVINRAAEYGRLRLKSRLLKDELVRRESPSDLVGQSPKLAAIEALVRKIAPTGSTVLIHGESGTGKELVANTVWKNSQRSEQPFVALNCATLSENIMESELFGHEKGAFTTAYQTKHGLVEVADGGTLFLDEVAEIPLQLQAKLLRFLDSGEFRRVGGTRTLRVDVRTIAATNRHLAELTEEGRFRQDLFYRLNVIAMEIPPLRERPEDVPELARHFLRIYSQRLGKNVHDISPEALEKLRQHRWPGNVRELENEMERAVTLSDSDIIGPADLTVSGAPRGQQARDELPPLDKMERDYILRVLRETGGNQTRASKILGINRKTLYLKLRSYGLLDQPSAWNTGPFPGQ